MRKFRTKSSNKRKLILNIFLFLFLLIGVGYSTVFTNLGINGDIILLNYRDLNIKQTSSTDRTAFRSDTYRENIKTITLNDSISAPSNVIESWDISENGTGGVMAYIVQNANDNTKYDLYIQGNGRIYSNKDSSYLFYGLTSLETINNLNKLTTTKTTNMSNMFAGDSNLKELDLSNFNMSKVTNTTDMLTGDANLSRIKTPKTYPTSNTITLTNTLYDNSDTSYLTINSSSPRDTWISAKYNVTLDADGGSGGTTRVVVKYASAMPSITIPTKDGFLFGGYYSGTNGTGSIYYDASGISANNCDITSNKVLYAKWIPPYEESLLNGAIPIYSDNLVPVTIDASGVVRKANIYSEWYKYQDKKWANAVILKDNTNYNSGDIILENNIESYFVWIPKYSYKIWDLGNYVSRNSDDSAYVERSFPIEIRFGTSNTTDSATECITPLTSGTSRNCSVDKYMTHPAFISMNTNGIWVGKFETGYKGASDSSESAVDSVNVSKIIIKPDVYGWHDLSIETAYNNSFNYKRGNNSHLLKNTEWGAVAYLTNSKYGICTENSCTRMRNNNNSDFKTGYGSLTEATCGWTTDDNMNCRLFGTTSQYTSNWTSTNGLLSSTTLNVTGIYDISGGAWEYVSGFMMDSTNTTPRVTTISFDSSNYFDAYNYSTLNFQYSNRILGDAVGETGPFFTKLYEDINHEYVSRRVNSWNYNYSNFFDENTYCIVRGGDYISGSDSGPFAMHITNGTNNNFFGFRIALTQ